MAGLFGTPDPNEPIVNRGQTPGTITVPVPVPPMPGQDPNLPPLPNGYTRNPATAQIIPPAGWQSRAPFPAMPSPGQGGPSMGLPSFWPGGQPATPQPTPAAPQFDMSPYARYGDAASNPRTAIGAQVATERAAWQQANPAPVLPTPIPPGGTVPMGQNPPPGSRLADNGSWIAPVPGMRYFSPRTGRWYAEAGDAAAAGTGNDSQAGWDRYVNTITGLENRDFQPGAWGDDRSGNPYMLMNDPSRNLSPGEKAWNEHQRTMLDGPPEPAPGMGNSGPSSWQAPSLTRRNPITGKSETAWGVSPGEQGIYGPGGAPRPGFPNGRGITTQPGTGEFIPPSTPAPYDPNDPLGQRKSPAWGGFYDGLPEQPVGGLTPNPNEPGVDPGPGTGTRVKPPYGGQLTNNKDANGYVWIDNGTPEGYWWRPEDGKTYTSGQIPAKDQPGATGGTPGADTTGSAPTPAADPYTRPNRSGNGSEYYIPSTDGWSPVPLDKVRQAAGGEIGFDGTGWKRGDLPANATVKVKVYSTDSKGNTTSTWKTISAADANAELGPEASIQFSTTETKNIAPEPKKEEPKAAPAYPKGPEGQEIKSAGTHGFTANQQVTVPNLPAGMKVYIPKLDAKGQPTATRQQVYPGSVIPKGTQYWVDVTASALPKLEDGGMIGWGQFIAGDSSDGKPNPEMITLGPQGAQVTPLDRMPRGVPRYEYGGSYTANPIGDGGVVPKRNLGEIGSTPRPITTQPISPFPPAPPPTTSPFPPRPTTQVPAPPTPPPASWPSGQTPQNASGLWNQNFFNLPPSEQQEKLQEYADWSKISTGDLTDDVSKRKMGGFTGAGMVRGY